MITVELPEEGMEAADNEESLPPFSVVPQSLGLAGLGRHHSKLNDGPAENPEGFQFPTPVHLNGCPKDSLVVAGGREWALYHHVKQMAEQASDVCGLRLYVEHENRNAQKTYESLGMADAGYRMMEITL